MTLDRRTPTLCMSEPVIEFDEDAEGLPDEWDLEDMPTLLLLGAIAGFGLFVLLNAALI
jgi:hypothetical protein